MKKEITVVLANHPFSRQYNIYGGAIDIKRHSWIHVNAKLISTPKKYSKLLEAFSKPNPFELLEWDFRNDCSSKTISRWTIRESPVASQEGDGLWLSFECLDVIPENFFVYIVKKFDIKINVSYCEPYQVKWKLRIYEQNFFKNSN